MGNQHKELDIDGCQKLANAIVLSCVKSYRRSLKALKKNPKNKSAMKEALDCQAFFEGDWMKTLTEVDGEWLMRKLQEEVRESC